MTTVAEKVIENLRSQAREAMGLAREAMDIYLNAADPTDEQLQKTKLTLQNTASTIEAYQLRVRYLNEAAMQTSPSNIEARRGA